MENTFTYVIRSLNKDNSTDNTNNCAIRLSGLPSQYKYFDCTVSALHISTISGTFTTATFELRADVLDIVNGRDSKGGSLNTIAFASFNNTYPQGAYTFRCSNFNGRNIKFQLYDESNALLTSNYYNGTALAGVKDFNRPWILILNMVGVLE